MCVLSPIDDRFLFVSCLCFSHLQYGPEPRTRSAHFWICDFEGRCCYVRTVTLPSHCTVGHNDATTSSVISTKNIRNRPEIRVEIGLQNFAQSLAASISLASWNTRITRKSSGGEIESALLSSGESRGTPLFAMVGARSESLVNYYN